MEQEDKIEKLAQATANEFANVHREIASTKTEILSAIEDLSLHVNAWMSDAEHRFKDVEHRLNVIESKVGLRN